MTHNIMLPGKELPILWENNHFLVINKPSGLASHPGPQTRDSVETRFVPQKRGGPWLVHRLDQETSGCLLIAKRKTPLIAAQKTFEKRLVKKTYWALIEGHLPSETGSITAPLIRSESKTGWHIKAVTSSTPQAQNAKTLWRVLGQNKDLTWVELQLLTGRTHQARVHLAHMGAPILGDHLYGKEYPGLPLQLLSRSLELTVQETHISAIAPPSALMARYLKDFPLFEPGLN
ncbi:RluA family pseudouridine synthase [Aristophania vespae]|nr:RluA family pseudouridine synthase [Aristophania vespae]